MCAKSLKTRDNSAINYSMKGVIFMLAAGLAFALSTVFAKIVTQNSNVPAIEITFLRFLLGLIVVSLYVARKRFSLKPVNFKYVGLRAVTNLLAVICFFIGIQYTTVTKSNLLNMTYPIFIFLLAPYLNREKTTLGYYLYLFLTIAGIYLVVIPDASALTFDKINFGDLMSLLSGVLAAFSLSILREARKYDDSYIILFYLMGIGTVLNFFMGLPYFVVPAQEVIIPFILSASSALIGQICITFGYKFINAAGGALIQSSRIIFAMVLGILFLSDSLTVQILCGAGLIMVSLTGVSGFFNRLPGTQKNAQTS